MLPLLLALAAPIAMAHDDDDDEPTSYEVIAISSDDCGDEVVIVQDVEVPEPPRPHHPLRFQVSALQSDRSPWLAGQFRLAGRKDAYLGVEGRIAAEGAWVGRIGAGFDILGKSDWDLKLGLFLGGMGNGLWRSQGLIVGTEIGLGARIGPLYGTYRWLGGIGGRYPELIELHNEHDFIVGFRIWDQLRVFGQAIYSRPGSGEGATALGLGIAFRI